MLKPGVLMEIPPGAAGCVEIRSVLTSVKAYMASRPWPSGVVISSEET